MRQSEQEVTVVVVFAAAVGHVEVVDRNKFYPAIYAWLGFSDLANVLEALVVGQDL